jgi:hypothetical protein
MSAQYQTLNNNIVIEFLQEKYDIYLEYFNITNDTITCMTQKEKLTFWDSFICYTFSYIAFIDITGNTNNIRINEKIFTDYTNGVNVFSEEYSEIFYIQELALLKCWLNPLEVSNLLDELSSYTNVCLK